MDITLQLSAVVLLLAANGLFVAAEFAMVKVNAGRRDGPGDGAAVPGTAASQAELEVRLSACQLGVTLVCLGLGWLGGPLVTTLLEPLFRWFAAPGWVQYGAAVVIGLVLLSSLLVVFGDRVPRTLALDRPGPMADRAAYPLHLFGLAVGPLDRLLDWATLAVVRLFRREDRSRGQAADPGNPGVPGSEGNGCRRQGPGALSVEGIQARDLMIPLASVRFLDPGRAWEENLRVIRECEYSCYPLLDGGPDGTVLGVVPVRDLQRALLDGAAAPRCDLRRLCRRPLAVPETESLPDLLVGMRARAATLALVLDARGALAGVVTLELLLDGICGTIPEGTLPPPLLRPAGR